MSTIAERRGLDINLRSGPQMREYIAIADRIAADRPGKVLDWGCGWGQVSRLMLDRGLNVSSFDFNPNAERRGEQPLEKYPEITVFLETSDPVGLPYEDGSFDAVLSCGVLEHVSQPEASLDELHRVLRPGGTLYVFKLPNRFSYLEAIARRTGLYYHGKLPDDRLYDLRTARKIVSEHGFSVRELRRANMLPLTVDHPAVHRASHRIWSTNRLLAKVPGVNVFATNVELVATRD